MGSLQKIAEKVLRSYPELSEYRIDVMYKNYRGAYAKYWYTKRSVTGPFDIGLSEELRYASPGVKTAVIAHELAHISRDVKKAKVSGGMSYEDHMYRRSRIKRMRDERGTDIMVVRRGFGPELIEFLKYYGRKNGGGHPEGGLDTDEVKLIMKRSAVRQRRGRGRTD